MFGSTAGVPSAEEGAQPERFGVVRTLLVASPLVVLPGVAVLVLWWAGLFESVATPSGGVRAPSAELAAGLGVIGVSITAAAALVAALVKQSIDSRNHQLALDAASRERETLRIQQIETVMRAVELLAEDPPAHDAEFAGERSPVSTRASGAVLALGSLGQIRLALTLLFDLWPQGRVSSTAVDDVVERSFLQADEDTRRLAIQLLYQNVERLDVSPGFWIWPRPLQSWEGGWSPPLKLMVIGVLDRWLDTKGPRSGDDLRLGLLKQASRDLDDETRAKAAAVLVKQQRR